MTASAGASSTIFFIIEVIGTIAFGLSGVIAAAQARMDWLAACVLAVVVAVGGGTLRDILVGRLPVFWIENPWTVLVALGAAIAGITYLKLRPLENLSDSNGLLIADAAGLSAFVIIGTQIGLMAGREPFLAVILGTITGTAGGVTRDILTGQKPKVLVGQIYALAAIVGATFYVSLVKLGVDADISIWLPMLTIFAIRMVAIKWHWSLPIVSAVEGPVPKANQTKD
jgi:uncharacterized membrane protein YeiH